MAKKVEETVWISCPNCGGKPKKHIVRAEFTKTWDGDWAQVVTHHQVCECAGCEQVRFRSEEWSSESALDEVTGQPVPDVSIFPEFRTGSRKPMDSSAFPSTVQQIYRETVAAFNAGIHKLAAGGLRAIVEAICLDQKASGNNLLKKIDELAQKGLLARPQANFLHEARYLGNEALHQLQEPTADAIADGLDIVESLLNTIYVLPVKADRMKQAREKKKAPPGTRPPMRFVLKKK